jgi:hypothetical protein
MLLSSVCVPASAAVPIIFDTDIGNDAEDTSTG